MKQKYALAISLILNLPAEAEEYSRYVSRRLTESFHIENLYMRANLTSFFLNSDNIINTADFGVVCDGIFDNAAAFDEVSKSANYGATIYFPPSSKNCLTSRPLSVRSNIKIYAIPGTVTLAPTPTNISNPSLFSVKNANNVSVLGLAFEGSHGPSTKSNSLVEIYKSTAISFDHTEFRDTSGIAMIFSSNVSESGVAFSRFINIGNKWQLTGATSDQKQGLVFCCGVVREILTEQPSLKNDLVVSSIANLKIGQLASGKGISPGSYVLAINHSTVTLSEPTNSAIQKAAQVVFSNNNFNYSRNNYFHQIGLDAISATNQSNFVSQENRFISVGGRYSNGGAADYVAASDNIIIQGEIISGTFGNGIDVYRSSNVIIIDNVVDRAGGGGITFSAGRNAKITRNISKNSNQGNSSDLKGGIVISGISSDGPVSDVAISFNKATDDQISKTQPYGIQLRQGSFFRNIQIYQNNSLAGNAISSSNDNANVH